mmetsp:Transcript_96087/g.140395  ORF Transcript_96087/g.140395 Transcript_96087/m.140395 type:complete len:261 (-) Transcript_96087:1224-2006(-)
MQQRGKRKRLSRAPINTGFRLENGLALIAHQFDELPMDVEPLRKSRDPFAQHLKRLLGHGGFVVLAELEHGFVALPLRAVPRRGGWPVGRILGFFHCSHEDLISCSFELGDFLCSHAPLCQQLITIHLQHIRLFFDDLIHERLREHGLIDFVVPVPPETDDVNYHVLSEQLPVLCSAFHRPAHSFRVIAVDMENRRAHRLCNISAVRRRAREAGVSRKSNLVVGNDVDRSSGGVALNIRELQRLIHYALSSKGSIPVQHN